MRQLVLAGEIAAGLAVHGGLDVLVRREVVEHDHDLFLVEDLFGTRLAEFRYGQRDGDVVAHHDVELGFNELSGRHAFQSGVGGQYLLSYGHTHGHILERIIFSVFYAGCIKHFSR